MTTVVYVAEQAQPEEGLPALAWGGAAFGILLVLLLVLLTFGKGRPHA